MPRQTTFLKPGEANASWRHVDADGQVLGRMAVKIARVLMGKHRPDWTPHVNCGDFVIVTNAEKIVLTGRKADQRMVKSYSGYPGGLKLRSVRNASSNKQFDACCQRHGSAVKCSRNSRSTQAATIRTLRKHQRRSPADSVFHTQENPDFRSNEKKIT
jgi:ribosomal protein L13